MYIYILREKDLHDGRRCHHHRSLRGHHHANRLLIGRLVPLEEEDRDNDELLRCVLQCALLACLPLHHSLFMLNSQELVHAHTCMYRKQCAQHMHTHFLRNVRNRHALLLLVCLYAV